MSEFTLSQAILQRRSLRQFAGQSVPLKVLDRLLWAAQGTTDEGGNRTVPSAHALHPLRLYVSVGDIDGVEAGVYAVGQDSHTLILHHDRDVRAQLQEAALENQPWISSAAGIISICADLVAPSRDFAEQPPYGVRGLRYVYIEAGAAAQNIHLQAAAEGLGCVLVAGFRDEVTASLLNLDSPIGPILHMCFGWPLHG